MCNVAGFTCVRAPRNVNKLCSIAAAIYFKCFNVDSVVARISFWVVCTVLGSQVGAGCGRGTTW